MAETLCSEVDIESISHEELIRATRAELDVPSLERLSRLHSTLLKRHVSLTTDTYRYGVFKYFKHRDETLLRDGLDVLLASDAILTDMISIN